MTKLTPAQIIAIIRRAELAHEPAARRVDVVAMVVVEGIGGPVPERPREAAMRVRSLETGQPPAGVHAPTRPGARENATRTSPGH